ncbi:MAG: hypothetical protein PVG38_09405, partial [Gammaproteobacteria bacterium]
VGWGFSSRSRVKISVRFCLFMVRTCFTAKAHKGAQRKRQSGSGSRLENAFPSFALARLRGQGFLHR